MVYIHHPRSKTNSQVEREVDLLHKKILGLQAAGKQRKGYYSLNSEEKHKQRCKHSHKQAHTNTTELCFKVNRRRINRIKGAREAYQNGTCLAAQSSSQADGPIKHIHMHKLDLVALVVHRFRQANI